MRGPAPTLHCPRCEADQPPGASPALVTCRECGLVFDPAAGARTRTRARGNTPAQGSGPPDGVEAQVSWKRGEALPMAICVGFSIVGMVTLTGWYSTLMAVIAAVSTYALLAVSFNVTTIRLDEEALTSTTRPFPRWLQRRIARSEIIAARLVHPHRRDDGYSVVIDHESPRSAGKRSTWLVSCRGHQPHAQALAMVSQINRAVRPAPGEEAESS